MPSIAISITIGEKDFHKMQPKASVRDSKGTAIYTPVIILGEDDIDKLREKAENLLRSVFSTYKDTSDKRTDYIMVPDWPIKSGEPENSESTGKGHDA